VTRERTDRSGLAHRAALLALVLGGCGPAPADEAAPAERPSAAARWVEAVTPGDRSILEAPAEAVAAPGASALVAPPFAARVVRILVAPGDSVSAGDPLVEVVMPEVLDAAAIWIGSGRRRALREQRRDELEALRSEGLVESGRVFEQEASVVDVEGDRARALAVLRAAGVPTGRAASMLARGTNTLLAPIGGVVAEVGVRLGEVREPSGPPLIELLGTAPVRIEARLARELPGGAELSFVPIAGEPIALRDAPDAVVIDPTDGTRRMWISPREEQSLPDGLRGSLRVRLTRPGVVQVPARAVAQDPAGAFVIRRTEGGSERVRVQVLAAGGGSAIVEGALAPGEPIASDATRAQTETETGAGAAG